MAYSGKINLNTEVVTNEDGSQDIHNTFTLPSSPADRKKLQQMLGEVTALMGKMELLRGSKKDAIAAIHEEFDIPKKQLNKLARTLYKRNYHEIQQEEAEFTMLYEALSGTIVPKVSASDEE